MKAGVIVCLCGLTLYAPIELSRLIVAYGLDFPLICELSAIWVLYLLAIITLCKVVRV